MPRKRPPSKKPPSKPNDPRSTREKQKDFLAAYGDVFAVGRAAELANLDRQDHYRWYRKDAKYAKAFERRKEIAGHYLETEAITRAGDGWLEPVYYQGAPCGEVRRFDSGLMQFLLRGLLPEKYGSRTEITGAQGEPIQAKIEVVFVKPGDTSGDRQ
jgi:hypothetical protein